MTCKLYAGAASVALILLLTGCGQKLEGQYVSTGPVAGIVAFDFKDSKTVEMNTMGHRVETQYKIEDGAVKMNIQGQTSVFPIGDDGCLSTTWGKMCPSGSSAAAD
jgi:hypothetical protein